MREFVGRFHIIKFFLLYSLSFTILEFFIYIEYYLFLKIFKNHFLSLYLSIYILLFNSK